MSEKLLKKGSVKWFDSKRGYGFITDEDGKDIFVHYSDIKKEGFRALQDGENVSFELDDCDRGKKAVNVKIL